MFPKRYHNALFVCDWSRGRILAIAHQAARRHLQGHGRSVSRRPAAQRDRHCGRSGRLAVLLHRRPRHRRRHLSRGVGRQGARPSIAIAAKASPPRSNSRNFPAPGLDNRSRWSNNNWATTGGRNLSATVEDAKIPVASPRPRAGTDAVVRSASDARIAGRRLARHGRRIARQGGVPDGAVTPTSPRRIAWASCWKTRNSPSNGRPAKRSCVRRNQCPPQNSRDCWHSPDRYVAWAAGRALQQVPRATNGNPRFWRALNLGCLLPERWPC